MGSGSSSPSPTPGRTSDRRRRSDSDAEYDLGQTHNRDSYYDRRSSSPASSIRRQDSYEDNKSLR